jgi:hypothetical protein
MANNANWKRTKPGKALRWERLLMVLANGGPVTLQEIEDTMDYHNMSRISCEVYIIKQKERGGVVKVYKQGRKVVAYELINAQEMIDKHLTPFNFSVTPIVGRDGISSLNDLNAKADEAPSKLAQVHAVAAVKSAAKKKVKAPVIEDEVTEIIEQ